MDGWWYGRLRDGSKGLFPSNYVEPIPGQPEERPAAFRTTNARSEDGDSNLSELDFERSVGPATHGGAFSIDAGCDEQLTVAAGGRRGGSLSSAHAPLTPPRKAAREAAESDRLPLQGLVAIGGSPETYSPHSATSRVRAPATTPGVAEATFQTVGDYCPNMSDQEAGKEERSSTPLAKPRPGEEGTPCGAPTEACVRASNSRGSCAPVGDVASIDVAVSVGETKPDDNCDRAGADRRGGCQRHGFVTCVLCNKGGLVGSRPVFSDGQSDLPVQAAERRTAAFHLTALARGSSSNSGNSGGGNSRGRDVSVLPQSVASLGPISNPNTAGDNGGLRTKDAQRHQTSRTIIATPGARESECRPCERHLLLDCILCKMLPTAPGASSPKEGYFGRSASLPTLGGTIDGGGGHGRAGAPAMAATAAASVSPLFGTVRLDTAESACKKHNLPDCLLCISGAGITQSLHDSAIGGRHRSPVLRPPLSHSGGFDARRLSPSRSFDTQPPHGSNDDRTAGASSVATEKRLLGFGVDRRASKESPKLFGQLPLSPSTVHPAREAFGVDAVPALPDHTSPGAGRGAAGDSGSRDGNFHNNGVEMSASLRHLRRRRTTATIPGGQQDEGARSTLGAISSRRRRPEDSSSSKRNDDTADAALARSAAAYRGGRRHRHRGSGTPRRKRASKPLVGRRRQSGAQAETVASGARARESGGRGGDEDLAARAMTAALAVLR